jgi:hypothetical protein
MAQIVGHNWHYCQYPSKCCRLNISVAHSATGQTISHYRVIEKLAGEMPVVDAQQGGQYGTEFQVKIES